MKQVQHVLKEITSITLEIEENFPGLYQHLDENPMTFQGSANVDIDVLMEYRDGLKKQLEDYKRSHRSG